jgi:endonuclease-3
MLPLVQRIKKINSLLEKKYGKKIWEKGYDPLSELILTILSQNTSDTNSHRAYRSLIKKFKNWEKVRKAKVKEIEKAIKVGGLSEIKSKRIKDILEQIYEENKSLDLSFLKKWEDEQIKNYLLQFKGVGEKTAACVLLFSLKRKVMPVDTHILRVSKRLELLSQKTDSVQAHKIFLKLVPKNLVYSFHLNMIEQGRKVCKAKNPCCDICNLYNLCPYPKKKLINPKRGVYAQN